jgi:hypothetical protein
MPEALVWGSASSHTEQRGLSRSPATAAERAVQERTAVPRHALSGQSGNFTVLAWHPILSLTQVEPGQHAPGVY